MPVNCRKSTPADQRASEGEASFVDVVADLPADLQAAEPVQVGEGALDNPALGGEAGPVLSAASGNHWFHAEFADEVAVLFGS